MKISAIHHKTRQGIIKRNPGKVNTYLEHKQRMQRDINKFPIAFAFNEEQFKEGLKKLKATKEEVASVLGGGIIRKTDTNKLKEMFARHDKEHKELMKNKSYAYNMFRYELSNHEYGYTHDETDALRALGLTREQVNNNPMLREQLEKAKKDIRNR